MEGGFQEEWKGRRARTFSDLLLLWAHCKAGPGKQTATTMRIAAGKVSQSMTDRYQEEQQPLQANLPCVLGISLVEKS
ncbi:MAG TPA: hypothetical protein VN214_09280, partial [Pseudomonas sp.]|nr:hypothetical protein [Pseudomonas sp.]